MQSPEGSNLFATPDFMKLAREVALGMTVALLAVARSS